MVLAALFTQVPGRGILRTSLISGSRKFAYRMMRTLSPVAMMSLLLQMEVNGFGSYRFFTKMGEPPEAGPRG
jgi:hypothetical protein